MLSTCGIEESTRMIIEGVYDKEKSHNNAGIYTLIILTGRRCLPVVFFPSSVTARRSSLCSRRFPRQLSWLPAEARWVVKREVDEGGHRAHKSDLNAKITVRCEALTTRPHASAASSIFLSLCLSHYLYLFFHPGARLLPLFSAPREKACAPFLFSPHATRAETRATRRAEVTYIHMHTTSVYVRTSAALARD